MNGPSPILVGARSEYRRGRSASASATDFYETAEGDPDGGLPFGAIVCFDLATETAGRTRSRAVTPYNPPPTANTDERFVRLMRRGPRRYCANISIFLVSLW